MLHIKGYVLRLFADRGPLWTDEVIDAVESEYGVSGAYWRGTVRLTLVDLYAGGLLSEQDATVDPARTQSEERVLFRYALTDFGRERMAQSGLATQGAQA
ncbi:hypothetical protein [Actinomycetospora aeridis]|uniref:PadR family transcriptional regulator n=1 Tax=Actinomycetospora aeridis TaxID=3129231 RepID=A0ABU8NC75_9PSEU